jgi:hypothetical protein
MRRPHQGHFVMHASVSDFMTVGSRLPKSKAAIVAMTSQCMGVKLCICSIVAGSATKGETQWLPQGYNRRHNHRPNASS